MKGTNEYYISPPSFTSLPDKQVVCFSVFLVFGVSGNSGVAERSSVGSVQGSNVTEEAQAAEEVYEESYQGDNVNAESEQGSNVVFPEAEGAEDKSSDSTHGPDADGGFSVAGGETMKEHSANRFSYEAVSVAIKRGPSGVSSSRGTEESSDVTYGPDTTDGFSSEYWDSANVSSFISVSSTSDSTVEGPIISETGEPGRFIGASPQEAFAPFRSDEGRSRIHADPVSGSDESDGSDDLKRKRAGGSQANAKRVRLNDPRFSPEVRLSQEEDAFRAYRLRNTAVRNTRRERLKREAEREEIARGKRPKH